MNIQHIKKSTLQPALWQGGQTFEYLIFPPNSKYTERNFDMRISSATIETVPSLFTQFDGYQRYLVMLDSTLNIVHNGSKEQYEEGDLFAFESNALIESFSIGSDFNLMLKKGIEAKVTIETELEHSQEAKYIVLFALQQSTIMINQVTYLLEKTDCLWIEQKDIETIAIKVSGKVVLAMWN
ncbi:MAG: HutD family protein [Flavobacteriaceae bacterium]|jgi:environmental stress-induced protein Ves|nr:HutD family protein [Flavobacteriaceae bacterium]